MIFRLVSYEERKIPKVGRNPNIYVYKLYINHGVLQRFTFRNLRKMFGTFMWSSES